MRFVRPLAVLVALAAIRRAVASAAGVKGGGMTLKPASSSLPVRTFAIVNRYVEWHKLPLPLALLNLEAFRDVLREQNLHDTSPPSPGRTAGLTKPDLHRLYWRSEDGTNNDLND